MVKSSIALLLFLLCPSLAQCWQLPAADTGATARLQEDFERYDKHFLDKKPVRAARLRDLAERMYAAERKGVSNSCGHQILFETEEMLVTSAHFDRIDRQLERLETAILHPQGDEQDADGMWGSCIDAWYLKLYVTYDRLESAEPGSFCAGAPLPKFLDRVATPKKLKAYLDRLSISNVAQTGIDNSLEFNQTLSVLLRILVFGEPQQFQVDPALKDAFLERLLGPYRNHRTGYWGERYKRGAHIAFQDDLSTTFHVVSFLKGQFPEMNKITETTLAISKLDYPVGWLWNGQFWNHNNMDVVTLFRYSWPTATETQRHSMHDQVERMLTWCLNKSLQPDGSFTINIADGSVEDAEYYGAAFLARIGYFNPKLRFWTDESFPRAEEVKVRINQFVEAHHADNSIGDHYKRVIQELER